MKKDNLILNFIGGFLAGLTAVDTISDQMSEVCDGYIETAENE